MAISETNLTKALKISRNPKATFDHIMQEEIFGSIDAIEFATDFGNKFVSSHQVVLGGLEKAREELVQIQDLVICGIGSSKFAGEYGAFIMRELEIFNSVHVFEPHKIQPNLFKNLNYGGFLTVTQSGENQSLIDMLKSAFKSHLTCFNIVNVENSPIT